jgi:hypothetical protein
MCIPRTARDVPVPIGQRLPVLRCLDPPISSVRWPKPTNGPVITTPIRSSAQRDGRAGDSRLVVAREAPSRHMSGQGSYVIYLGWLAAGGEGGI